MRNFLFIAALLSLPSLAYSDNEPCLGLSDIGREYCLAEENITVIKTNNPVEDVCGDTNGLKRKTCLKSAFKTALKQLKKANTNAIELTKTSNNKNPFLLSYDAWKSDFKSELSSWLDYKDKRCRMLFHQRKYDKTLETSNAILACKVQMTIEHQKYISAMYDVDPK